MKKLIMTTIISIMMLSPMVAQANPTACKAYLCLAGSAQGAKGNVAACSQAVVMGYMVPTRVYSPYYNPVATAANRAQYIAQCPKTDPKMVALIAANFGMPEFFNY